MSFAKGEIKGVAFDLDGTLLDTETLYKRFWVEAAVRMGYPMRDEHALMIRATQAELAQQILREHVDPEFDFYGVRELRRVIMEEYVDEHGVEPKDGMYELLDALKARGVRMVVATATQPDRARKYLRMVKADHYFDEIICASMVPHGKPAPDIYLLAAERMGLRPDQALAVEDAPSGIRSAHAAGMHRVLIPDQDEPGEELRALCEYVLPSLRDLIDMI
ncbi:MAG: HAD family phosphatase [Clostridia bacterium]|nr:HAD family phosphatase [Clostridia bacterium]